MAYVDFGAGIMILWMIIYHALGLLFCYELNGYWDIKEISLLPSNLKGFINQDGKLDIINPCMFFPYLHFFMPWFFYKSGAFFEKCNISKLWKKDWGKLMRTFIIWSLIGYVFYILFGLLDDSLTWRRAGYSVIRSLFLRGQIPLNGSLWFLLSLFIVRFVANITLPSKEDSCFCLRLFVLILMGYLISYLSHRVDSDLLPFWIANGAAGLCFFTLGYAMKKYEFSWTLILPCTIVYIVGCMRGFPMVDMLSNSLLSNHYVLWIPISFCCIIFFNAFCRIFCKYVRVKFIEIIGLYAMPIYVTHRIIIQSVYFLVTYLNIIIPSWLLMCLMLLSYVVFLPLSCKLFNTNRYKRIINELNV